MYGRYGKDQLNTLLLLLALLLTIVQLLWFRSIITTVILYALLILFTYRAYSRKIQARRKENQAYLNFTKPIRRRVKAFQKNRKDTQYRYFVCPDCSQLVRIPRNRGKVEIICPVCKKHFTRKA